jgi:polyphosphate kinase
MQRNFDRRVEIAFPVIESQLQAKLKEILEIQLADTVKGWRIQPDGTSARTRLEGETPLRSQEHLYEIMTRENGPLISVPSARIADS